MNQTPAHPQDDTADEDATEPKQEQPSRAGEGDEVPQKQLHRWTNEGGALPPDP